MVDISIQDHIVTLDIKGFDQLWSFKGSIEVPVAHIKTVYRAPRDLNPAQWTGEGKGGTTVPGLIKAGKYEHEGKHIFWDVHDPHKAIILEVHHEEYDTIIVEVADPEGAVSLIKSVVR